MFDEQPKGVVDIFQDTDKGTGGARGPIAPPPPAPVRASGPSKFLLGAIIFAILALAGGGYYYWYSLPRVTVSSAPKSADIEPPTNAAGNAPVNQAPAVNEPATNAAAAVNAPAVNEPATNAAPAVNAPVVSTSPAAVDTDGDGLPDSQEATLGTDLKKADTDGDGLSDGEEVNIYHTNPLKADTDGDGYSDGVEVKGGYNPNGPGKLFVVPATQPK
ncbi:MAG: hypothetical protein RLZZ324_68 [Candidatus Parcubacteria bacterium]|jgi:hypothetical protein